MKDTRTPQTAPASETQTAREKPREGRVVQPAGNAAAVSATPTEDPAASDPETTGALARALLDAAPDPATPPDLDRIQQLADAADLASRAALFHDLGFWADTFWARAPLAAAEARARVDPIRVWDLWLPALPDAEARAHAIAQWAATVPGDLPRLLARRRVDLLDGRSRGVTMANGPGSFRMAA